MTNFQNMVKIYKQIQDSVHESKLDEEIFKMIKASLS